MGFPWVRLGKNGLKWVSNGLGLFDSVKKEQKGLAGTKRDSKKKLGKTR